MNEQHPPVDPAPIDATLPRTWRPLGVRIAAIFFGAVLLVVVIAAALTLSPEARAKWTPFQVGTLVVLGAMFAAVFWGMARSRVTATAEGLEVVNGFRTHEYAWSQIRDIRLAKGQPWALLDLEDPTGEKPTHAVLALQSTDGDRAREAGRVIYALVHRDR